MTQKLHERSLQIEARDEMLHHRNLRNRPPTPSKSKVDEANGAPSGRG